MTKAFNLTAQINLRGPANLKPIVADIRRQLGSVSSDINIRLNPQVAKSINTVTDRLKSMNDMLVIAKNNSDLLNKSLFNLSSSLSNVGNSGNKSATAISKTGSSAKEVAQNIKESATTMEEFGKQSYLAVKRFAAFSIATTAIYQLINAISSGFVAFINFDKQLIKLQQVTGKGALGLKSLEKEITNLSVNLGISSESLIEVASTLAQAGLNAEETRIALVALAKTELAPSFDNLTDTTEGAIAALRQFELQAGDLEAVLGSINAVAAAFAVESKDIIAAIQRTGGVFATASKGVSEGKDALNEFIAVFTSVRQTTRESAETIATGLRTIFTRIQRGKTIEALKEYGIILTDLEGKFVGPYEAVKRLSEGLKLLDPRDLRFSEIVEELGGFRQIGKVIPLIQQFAIAQKALKIAQTGQGSLSEDQIVAQKSLANQIAKVREQFLALIRDLGKSTVFQGLFKIVTSLASSLISLAGAFKPILPFLGVLAAVKGASALTQFAGGFFGSMNKGGAKNGGDVSGSATGLTKEKEKSDATNKATEAIKANTAALNQLTSAVQSLSNKIGSAGGPTTLNSGGKVAAFARGGLVPGSGNGDTVSAVLTPGEFVIRKKAVESIGADKLHKMNKYALGGKVSLYGKQIANTYSSLKNKTQPNKQYTAKIKPVPESTGSIAPKMDKFRELYPNYPKWKLFEYAVAKKRGLKLAGGNRFLDFPRVLGEAKFLPPDATYAQDQETGFLKGNNNETMLAKLIGSGKYKKNATVRTYYPQKINDFRNFAHGGKIQKFMAGGIAEEYYGQKEVEAAKQAQAEYQQAIAEAFRLENIYFDTEEAKSIKEGTTPEVYGTGIGKLAKGQPGVVGRKSVSFTKAETGQLSDNDYKQIAKRFKDSALATRTAQIKAYTEAEESIATFKTSGLLENIDPNIMEYLSGTINNIKSSTIDPKTIASVTKKLTTPNAAAFSDLMKGKKVEVQGQRTKLAEIFNSILETYGSDVSPMEQSSITSRIADITLKQRSKEEPTKASLGGEIQRFMAGGAAQSINREALSPEELVSWISELGTPQEIRGLAGGTANIQSKLKSVISTKPATPKQIFDKRFILGDQSTPYLSAIQDLLEIADSNKSRPRVFSSEEKANATRLGLVGMFPLGLNDTRYEDISGRVVSIHTATLPKDKLETVLEMRKGIDEVLSRSTQALYGTTGQQLDDTTKEALGLGNLEGYMIEAILAKAGANPGRLDDRSVDYPTGLGAAAGLFGIDPNIPTEIKRDAKGGLSKARANFRNYFSKFAFGGFVQKFAAGGIAEADPIKQNKPKDFGKIALRKDANSITATYFKNNTRSGQVSAHKMRDYLYYVGLSQATQGYGPKLYDATMEAATEQGAMLTSDRNSVSGAAKKVWEYYFKNRGDVKKTPLKPDDWTRNQADIDPKLYGKPETWPPASDPAWTLQTGYSKTPSLINDPGSVIRMDKQAQSSAISALQYFQSKPTGFANGGSAEDTVPALLTPGEFVINKKAAKSIGYSRLHQMNKADKVQGFNKGGAVGNIQKFFVGGVAEKDSKRAQGQILSSIEEGSAAFAEIMSQLPTALKDIILSKFKGIEKVVSGQAMSLVKGAPAFSEKTRGMAAASSKASAIGLKITGKKGGATTETVAHETGHLADLGLGGGTGDFASETKGTFQFELIAKIKKQMENEFKKAGKSTEEINKYLGTGQELFAEFFAKASPEVRSIITSTTDAKTGMKALADSLGEAGYTYAGLEASDLMPQKSKGGTKKKDQFSYLKQQSKAIDEAKTGAVSFESLKPKTKTRKEAKQELDDSGLKALTTEIAQTSGEIAKLKAQTESLYQRSKSLDNQIGQYDQSILKIRASTEEGAKGNKALNRIIQMKIGAETQRLSVDKEAMASEEQLIALNQQKAQQISAAKTFKAVGVPSSDPSGGGSSGPDLPKINTQTAKENSEYFARKAEKAGMSVGGYKYSLAQQVGGQAYSIKQDQKFAKAETKDIAVGKSRELKGLNVKSGEFKSLLGEGATSDQAKKAQAAVSEFATNLQKIAPNMKPDEIRSAAEALAEGLATGTESVEELIAGNKQLAQIFATTISEGEALDEAFRRVAESAGISAETIKANVSPKALEQQAFIQSKEGQRFGKLAEFAPGLAQNISGAGGERLGKAADFVSGKGGKFSKGFASLGGFQGIGSGLAAGSEMLKTSGLISKQTLKDPNVAGAFGAVQGAGVGAATGAELGNQIAGPVGALIGGIGGAIIGGIKGFFDAKNAQILTNALDKLSKSSEGVDIAFKELAKNDTDKNFKNVQKAFGQQIEASKELENIAFGGGGEGPSVGGVGGGALAGAAGGALIGSFIPVIGTAIGAAVGAVVGGGVAYLSEGQNKANREEALRSRVGSAGAMNESAARMAERQMGTMTTEQLGQQEKTGTNIIAEQYKESAVAAAEAANGAKNLTAAQKEQVSQGAAETAYLDSYMKMRKEAGATDEKISEDIMADRKLALEAGKKALDSQSQAAQKQALLARATKEVALATESLLDVYRRTGANAQRFSDEIDDMLSGTQANIASLGGNASVQKVDRSGSERVLGNMAAYSSQEVQAATQEIVGKLGGGEDAQALGKQAEASKFLQDKLPAMLKADGADANDIINSLSQELSTMGLGGDAIDKMLEEMRKQISDNEEGGLGTLADEISSGGIDKFSMTAAEAAKTLQNLSKTYNDTLQKSIDLQNQYNETVMQSNSYLRKAGTIRINAELDLAKALGNSPTLEQLNQPFDFEIQDLTKGLVPGGTSDPAAIAAGITAKTAENQQLQAANANLGNVGMTGASGDAGAKLLSEQQKNIAAMGANSVAINEGRQALEKLANDGTKAANALGKIEEQQRQVEGLANRFEKIFTSSPEELFKMNRQSDALSLAQTAGAEQFKGRAFRQDAFAGLEQDKEFLRPEEYNKQRGMLIRKSLEAQGKTGQSMIEKGGVSMTVDDFIKRIEGGVSEEDPAVKAYREAVAVQIQANEKLAMLEELKSLQIQEAMLGLQIFLANEFPKILADAVKASKEDAQTKPETKTEASKGEKAKAEAEGAKTTAEKKRKELDTKIENKQLEVSKAEKAAGGLKWSPGAGAAMDVKIKKRELAELKAQRDSKVKEEEAAATKSKEADTTLSEEKKTKDQAKAAQVAEEKKAKEATVSSSMEQSQRARAGVAPATIPAPPAPGSPAAARDAELAKNRAEQAKAAESNKPQTPLTQQTQTASVMYGATQPQVQTVDKFTEDRLKEEKRKISSGLDSLTLNKAAKAKEIQRKEKTFKAAKIAASAAGTKDTSPTLAAAQESYEMAKADMESIDQQMKEAQDKTNAINQKLTPSTTEYDARLPRTPENIQKQERAKAEDAFAGLEQDKEFLRPEEYNKQRGMLIRKSLEAQGKTGQSMIEKGGVSMTVDDFIKRIEGGVSEPASQPSVALQTQAQTQATAIRSAAQQENQSHTRATPEQLGEIRRTAPVSSNLPKPVEYSRQAQAADTGTPTQPTQPTEKTAQLLTLDQSSLDGLNSFNTNFGAYVDKLVNFQFPTIPEKIEMTGTHTVDVRVSGAAAFESLQKNIQDLINKEIDVKMAQIWKQTGGQIGQRPGTPPSKGK